MLSTLLAYHIFNTHSPYNSLSFSPSHTHAHSPLSHPFRFLKWSLCSSKNSTLHADDKWADNDEKDDAKNAFVQILPYRYDSKIYSHLIFLVSCWYYCFFILGCLGGEVHYVLDRYDLTSAQCIVVLLYRGPFCTIMSLSLYPSSPPHTHSLAHTHIHTHTL